MSAAFGSHVKTPLLDTEAAASPRMGMWLERDAMVAAKLGGYSRGRQHTGDSVASTVASESDYFNSHSSRGIERALYVLRERRGWKHWFRQRIDGFIMFALGLVLGGLILHIYQSVFLSKEPQKVHQWAPPPEPAYVPTPYEAVPPPSKVPDDYMYAVPLDNSCLIPNLATPSGPQTFDACGFVINSTDEVWNKRGNVDAAIEKYFHEDYLNAGSWGKRPHGKTALRDAVYAEMRAFPDIQIHITDCVCKGDDVKGYKCAMPDVLTGTNLGPSAYGPATGRYARWTGMVQSWVKKNPKNGQWQYYAEWGVHDEWALIQQLGLDFNRVPHPSTNPEPLHDCLPLLQLAPGTPTLTDADAKVAPVVERDGAQDSPTSSAQ